MRLFFELKLWNLARWLEHMEKDGHVNHTWRLLLASEFVTETLGEMNALWIGFMQAISLDPRYFIIGRPYDTYDTRWERNKISTPIFLLLSTTYFLLSWHSNLLIAQLLCDVMLAILLNNYLVHLFERCISILLTTSFFLLSFSSSLFLAFLLFFPSFRDVLASMAVQLLIELLEDFIGFTIVSIGFGLGGFRALSVVTDLTRRVQVLPRTFAVNPSSTKDHVKEAKNIDYFALG